MNIVRTYGSNGSVRKRALCGARHHDPACPITLSQLAAHAIFSGTTNSQHTPARLYLSVCVFSCATGPVSVLSKETTQWSVRLLVGLGVRANDMSSPWHACRNGVSNNRTEHARLLKGRCITDQESTRSNHSTAQELSIELNMK